MLRYFPIQPNALHMESNKNKRDQWNARTGLYFNMGLVLTMMLVVLAFEWKTYDEVSSINFKELPKTTNDPIMVHKEVYERPKPPKPIPVDPIIIPTTEPIPTPEDSVVIISNPVTEPSIDSSITQLLTPPPPVPTDEPFLIVEEEATPVGGTEAFYKFLRKNLQYPRKAKNLGIEGRVYVEFVVDEKGVVTQAKTIRGIGYGCDEEAERVIKMIRWNPAKQRARPVKVRMTLPINFQLGK